MNYLLDTYVLLWIYTHNDLPTTIKSILLDRKNHIYVSIVSFWECAIKASIKKLEYPSDLYARTVQSSIEVLPITIDDIAILESLPMHHKDPFDRMIISQAKNNNSVLVTADKKISKYQVLLQQVEL